MSDGETPLVVEFAQPSREAWLKLVDEVLRGADFGERLISRTPDGLAIQPLYTRGDRGGRVPPVWPQRRGWDARQRHAEPDAKRANAAILEDLAGGVGSLLLQIEAPGQFGIDYGRDALEKVLEGVALRRCAIALDARENTLDAAGSLIELWRAAGIGEAERAGAFNLDPLGVLAKTGTLYYPAERACAMAAKFAADCQAMSNVRVLLADGRPYHEAGGSESQELAALLATLVAYLRACEVERQPPGDAFDRIGLGLAADGDLFLTIAKLRAARRLVARVAEVCGVARAASTAHITATTCERMLTRRDPWVNILRTTVACAGAAMGGADAICVLPFTWALGKADARARRIARNIHAVLREESALARVDDPAGGSFGLEALTNALASAAWTLFQQIEAKGGMARALESGFLQGAIAEVAETRDRDIAHGRSALTGVSAYALLAERGIDVEPHPPVPPIVKGGTEVAPLRLHRLAEPFERLRDASDAHLARTGKRPQLFLAMLGEPAMYAARADFIVNFLAAGGIEALSGQGSKDPTEAASAFAASGASIACICSSDRLYAELAAATARALREAGARKVLLAGRPHGLGEGFGEGMRAAGIDAFIAAGDDALATLAMLHGALNVAA
jgi:methylmalonyl-CoA mutase